MILLILFISRMTMTWKALVIKTLSRHDSPTASTAWVFTAVNIRGSSGITSSLIFAMAITGCLKNSDLAIRRQAFLMDLFIYQEPILQLNNILWEATLVRLIM